MSENETLQESIPQEDALQENVQTKEEKKKEISRLQKYLSGLQQKLRESRLPVVVLVEGWDAAGKGTLINKLISEIDPRFLTVFSQDICRKMGESYPFLYPYFYALPEDGKLLFMDSGWMESVVRDAMQGNLTLEEYHQRILSVNRFERQLRDNGYLVVKFFVQISRKMQKKRLKKLSKNKDTAWRVRAGDWYQNENYEDFREMYEDFMEKTGDITPWHILNGESGSDMKLEAFRLLTQVLDEALAAGKYCGEPFEEEFPMTETPRLAEAELTARLEREEYKAELERLQDRISQLQNAMYRRKIPMVICYEGWDAAGKGGNIRRLAYPLDPRGFTTYPISAPEPHEKNRHFLWRFWTRLPQQGGVSIFDRTWYGRVMVERIEGFCSEKDWKRAYNEINEFEEELHNWGAVVLKFWLHIDQDTQLARFENRQNTPEKQWKITEEDWRNREKWPQYEQAVSDMLEKTSTTFAPWHIIESNDKYYARIKVLRIVAQAMEDAINAKKGE